MALNSQQPGPSRFILSRDRRHEPKTQEQTMWGIAVFKSWLEERRQLNEFELQDPAAIDELLATFYLEARQMNGQPYSKSALRCIRASVQ